MRIAVARLHGSFYPWKRFRRRAERSRKRSQPDAAQVRLAVARPRRRTGGRGLIRHPISELFAPIAERVQRNIVQPDVDAYGFPGLDTNVLARERKEERRIRDRQFVVAGRDAGERVISISAALRRIRHARSRIPCLNRRLRHRRTSTGKRKYRSSDRAGPLSEKG